MRMQNENETDTDPAAAGIAAGSATASQATTFLCLPRDIRANFFNIRAQKDELEEEMREINVRIEASRNHLFSEKELEPFMGNALEAIEDGLQNEFQWELSSLHLRCIF